MFLPLCQNSCRFFFIFSESSISSYWCCDAFSFPKYPTKSVDPLQRTPTNLKKKHSRSFFRYIVIVQLIPPLRNFAILSRSTRFGWSRRRSSLLFTFGRFSNRYRKYQYGSIPFAFAVSIKLYMSALASAPRGLQLKSQFFRPTTKGHKTFST